MSEINDLYQAVILDHNAKPRNFGTLEGSTHHADGYNPLCGDRFTVYLTLEGEVIQDLRFDGSGCAISKASASLMTQALKGKTRDEAKALFEIFHGLMTAAHDADVEPMLEDLGKLAVFQGVREYPSRVKCATLSWHTVHGALADSSDAISTE